MPKAGSNSAQGRMKQYEAEFLHLSDAQMLMSQGASSLEKKTAEAAGALARPCRCARTDTGSKHSAPVCCGGTTSAVRAILPSRRCYFLPFNISCPLSPFIRSSLVFPFIPLILRHPHPTHPPSTTIHPHRLFCLCLSFSPSVAPTRSR